MAEQSLKPILLIDNVDSFTYNLYQQVQSQTPHPVLVYRNHGITLEEVVVHNPQAIILSPGPGHPANDADFGVCREIVLAVLEGRVACPVLGVCLGFQGIVHYCGGVIEKAPTLKHGKVSQVAQVAESPLLAGLPNSFPVMRYHSWCAAKAPWPHDLEILVMEPEQQVVMAIQHRKKPLYGVQFHPESIGTPDGQQLLRNFLVTSHERVAKAQPL